MDQSLAEFAETNQPDEIESEIDKLQPGSVSAMALNDLITTRQVTDLYLQTHQTPEKADKIDYNTIQLALVNDRIKDRIATTPGYLREYNQWADRIKERVKKENPDPVNSKPSATYQRIEARLHRALELNTDSQSQTP